MGAPKVLGGDYAAVRASCEGDYVPVIIPALTLILERAQLDKGAPLTEAEVRSIRDRAPAIRMERADFEHWTASRAPDIDPEDAWLQWQERRSS